MVSLYDLLLKEEKIVVISINTSLITYDIAKVVDEDIKTTLTNDRVPGRHPHQCEMI